MIHEIRLPIQFKWQKEASQFSAHTELPAIESAEEEKEEEGEDEVDVKKLRATQWLAFPGNSSSSGSISVHFI